MKRMLAILLPVLLVLSLAACGTVENTVPETTVPSETDTTEATEEATVEPTEEPTEAPTDPTPTKLLEPFFPEPDPNCMLNCTLSLVDDTTIQVNVYQNATFSAEDVLNLQPGEGLLINETVYYVTDVNVMSHDMQSLTIYSVIAETTGGRLHLSQNLAYDTQGNLSATDFSVQLESNETVMSFYKSYTLDANTTSYYESNVVNGESVTESQGGMMLVQKLKEQPEVFTLENTRVMFMLGKPYSINVIFL